jgi:hypothetical protein
MGVWYDFEQVNWGIANDIADDKASVVVVVVVGESTLKFHNQK